MPPLVGVNLTHVPGPADRTAFSRCRFHAQMFCEHAPEPTYNACVSAPAINRPQLSIQYSLVAPQWRRTRHQPRTPNSFIRDGRAHTLPSNKVCPQRPNAHVRTEGCGSSAVVHAHAHAHAHATCYNTMSPRFISVRRPQCLPMFHSDVVLRSPLQLGSLLTILEIPRVSHE